METVTKKTYPKYMTWEKNAQTVEFVNKGDFHLPEILSTLGISEHVLPQGVINSLGATDRNEILTRQNAIRFLLENKEFKKFIEESYPTFSFPNANHEFVKHFNEDGKNSFRDFLNELVDKASLALSKNPKMAGSPIEKTVTFLRDTQQEVSEAESLIAGKLIPELKSRFDYRGLLTLKTHFDGQSQNSAQMKCVDKRVFGERRYAFYMDTIYKLFKIQSWSDLNKMEKGFKKFLSKTLFIIFLPITLVLLLINGLLEKVKYTTLVTSDLPNELERDIKTFFESNFCPNRDLWKYKEYSFEVFFTYNKDGLTVKLLDYDISTRKVDWKGGNERFIEFSSGIYKDGKSWYSGIKTAYFNFIKASLQKKANNRIYNLGIYSEMDNKLQNSGLSALVSRSGMEIGSNWGKNDLQFTSAMDVINGNEELLEKYSFLSQYREYVSGFYNELLSLCKTTTAVDQMLQKHTDATWSWPEILEDDKHLISFDAMTPMHLIGHHKLQGGIVKSQDLVPVSKLAPLNGQMMCLTGQNAGGKTASKVELVYQIFLAQSGFPVFSKTFALNPKKIIGLVFVERGKGSMVQLLLMKTRNILEAFEGHENNHSVIIIDELLTGTQEASALSIGKKTLEKLNSMNFSTIFSTQITALAEYAQKDLNALTYCFDDKHRISEGISSGNPDLLIKQLGMDKLLEISKN